MLQEIDRVQLAVPDAGAAAEKWASLLGAEETGRDSVKVLGAKRVTLALGTSRVELLEPDGEGAVDAALRKRGRAHLFAAGVSALDLSALERHLVAGGHKPQPEKGQLHFEMTVEDAPVRFVVSETTARAPVGDVSFLYEATLLVKDAPSAVKQFVQTFGLDAAAFKTIKSEHFGYEGTLTLFDPDHLHRFEIIAPTDPSTTMGRFFGKEGPCYYMAFCESAHLLEIEARAKAANAGITVERPKGRGADEIPDQMWLHPPALGGMMLGISRPTMAWSWSGHPERVEAVA